ncbi:MAG: response regulator [Acidobacteria bacterium]|nr:response regulator [Acidobacteriota bacterium]
MTVRSGTPELARVLVVDDDPTSRLTLQTVLRAGGYAVDSAASAAEAVSKMDEGRYELVLSDLGMESPTAGYRVMAHARSMEYRPAMALVTIYKSSETEGRQAFVETQDVPGLLGSVADLISDRATRRIQRRQARSS